MAKERVTTQVVLVKVNEITIGVCSTEELAREKATELLRHFENDVKMKVKIEKIAMISEKE